MTKRPTLPRNVEEREQLRFRREEREANMRYIHELSLMTIALLACTDAAASEASGESIQKDVEHRKPPAAPGAGGPPEVVGSALATVCCFLWPFSMYLRSQQGQVASSSSIRASQVTVEYLD